MSGIPIYPVHCRRCHATWYPKSPVLPEVCQRCKSRSWQEWPVETNATRGLKAWHQQQGRQLNKTATECADCQELLQEGHHG